MLSFCFLSLASRLKFFAFNDSISAINGIAKVANVRYVTIIFLVILATRSQ